MSLKHIDITSALRRVADRRIEEAMQEGKFDHLSGKGRPLELEPLPAEEVARFRWWALKILRNSNVTPDEVAWRKSIELLKAQLESVDSEWRVRVLVTQINRLVHKLNTLGTSAMTAATAVVGVSMETELEKLRQRRAPAA